VKGIDTIKSVDQLKGLMRNLQKEVGAPSTVLFQMYFIQRLIDRIYRSRYRDKFVLKGGALIAAHVGVLLRQTGDSDFSVVELEFTVDGMRQCLSEMVEIDLDDVISFVITNIANIMDNKEYPGLRISLVANYGKMRTPFHMDLSTGKISPPSPQKYEINKLLLNGKITVLAYPIEKILSEKLETLVDRELTNTRMRDFYDIHMLSRQKGLDYSLLLMACTNTFVERNTAFVVEDILSLLNAIVHDEKLNKLWQVFLSEHPSYGNLLFVTVVDSAKRMFHLLSNTQDSKSE